MEKIDAAQLLPRSTVPRYLRILLAKILKYMKGQSWKETVEKIKCGLDIQKHGIGGGEEMDTKERNRSVREEI